MSKNKKAPPKQITLTQAETDALLLRIHELKIIPEDAEILASMVAMTAWIQQQLSRARLSIKRLKKCFGFKSEAKPSVTKPNNDLSAGDTTPPPADNNEATDSSSDEANTDSNATEPTSGSSDAGKPAIKIVYDSTKNHGRLGVNDYTASRTIGVPLDANFNSRLCPECEESNTPAKLYPVQPSTIIILEGTPLISATEYELERVRCSICGAYFTAELPDGISGERYTASCITSIAIHHYGGGMPFNRLETLQAAQGVPLPDSTQYDLMNHCYQRVIAPVVTELRHQAAQGEQLLYDDTSGRILQNYELNRILPQKKSIHTTVILSRYQDQQICLFDTNQQTAGHSIKQLLSARETDDPFITMSDASSSNFTDCDEILLGRWIIGLCLAHARRRFVELLNDGAEDILFILAVIARVYQNDSHCKRESLSAQERLGYHQTHSAPIMEALRIWLNNQLKFNQVEPNSHLGEAMIYLLKHWYPLTQFVRIEGMPLDNNFCEQAVKVFIRYRKNALFYRTFYGATIGDAMMSVFQTCLYAQANVFDYLTTLQNHAQAVNDAPQNWLPWNYQQTLTATKAAANAISA